jgi:hypothetical protein
MRNAKRLLKPTNGLGTSKLIPRDQVLAEFGLIVANRASSIS